MILETQIYTLLFSFIFGSLFGLLVRINYFFLNHSNKFIKILFTVVFVTIFTLIYFIILEKLNSGIIHIYYFIMLILGFCLEQFIEKKIKEE